jgi:prepilin-type N-terminal cleavage/methylation domain-containing protein
MNNRKQLGFTLIELLIVIAIIGILATVVTTQFIGSTRKANEAAAVTTLNSIKVAQARYMIEHRGKYGTFAQLFDEGFLDKRFRVESPHIQGYVFTITLIDINDKQAAMFHITAIPEISEGVAATGKIFYFTQPDSGITFSKTGPATADDELL